MLKKVVGTIYNVIYRHDGNRGVEFFKKIANCLVQMISEVEGGNRIIAKNKVLQVEEALLLVTKALLSTLTLN